MSKSKHSEAQIVAALKPVEARRTTYDVAREGGVSKHTIHTWKSRFGGMDASEAQKLRAPEMKTGGSSGWWRILVWTEDAEGRDCKKRLELVDRRPDDCWLKHQFEISERRVCGLMSIAVRSCRYCSRRSDVGLKEKLVRLAREKPRYGYLRLQCRPSVKANE